MIGKRLKELLIKNNVTQAELSRKLGISPGAMSNFINDRRSPSFAVIAAIADYFSVEIDSFIARPAAKNSSRYLMFSELSERTLTLNTSGLWVKMDTDAYAPTVRGESLIYIDKTTPPEAHDCVVFYKRSKPSLYKLLDKNEGSVLIPLKKEDTPLDINGVIKGIYKVLYVAVEP